MEADIRRTATALNQGKIALQLGADGRAFFTYTPKDEFGDAGASITVQLPTLASLQSIKTATQADLTAINFLINNYPT